MIKSLNCKNSVKELFKRDSPLSSLYTNKMSPEQQNCIWPQMAKLKKSQWWHQLNEYEAWLIMKSGKNKSFPEYIDCHQGYRVPADMLNWTSSCNLEKKKKWLKYFSALDNLIFTLLEKTMKYIFNLRLYLKTTKIEEFFPQDLY